MRPEDVKRYGKIDKMHLTERFDHVVPNAYRQKSFSRVGKSHLHAKPNDFGSGLKDGF